jgi:GT2 family glycosyltransferase
MLTRGLSDLLTRSLDGVLKHTRPGVPILIMDDCGPDDNVESLLVAREHELQSRDVFFLRRSQSVGFAENMNLLFGMAAPADVLILNDDCEVAEGWFEGLLAAAYSDSTIASATALTNHGSVLSIPERNHPIGHLPDGWTVDGTAAAVRRASKRLYPHLPTIVGHCAYIKRSALELVGDFDLAFSPGYGEEVDFSQRCLLRGLSHVVADDVFVFHQGSKTFSVRAAKLQEDHERILAKRYPYYHGWVREVLETRSGPLDHALTLAIRALTDLSVTIDGSCLGMGITGTQIHILELLQGLHRTGRLRLRVALPGRCDPYAAEVLDRLDGVEQILIDHVDERTKRTDVAHRPWQVNSPLDLRRLRQMGNRVVVTQQDFIAYRNPGYFASFDDFERYRQCTRLSLTGAERVVFFSHHAACQAQKEELVEPERSRVVYIGVDHHLAQRRVEPRRPAEVLNVDGHQFILCLGVDFIHKNRLFALQLLEQLQARHRWDGWLVLAGPQASPGSSATVDEAFLRKHPAVAAATAVLGGVSEEEKRWLFTHATLVISPTTHEGFGLIPFEAAEAGVPCLFAPQASLAEVLPPDLALIEPWDAAVTSDRAMHLLGDAAERERLVDSVREAAARYRWDQTAEEILKVYNEAAEAPGLDLSLNVALAQVGSPAPVSRGPLHIRGLAKTVNWWQGHGVVRGTWLGARALARKVVSRARRRLPLPGR